MTGNRVTDALSGCLCQILSICYFASEIAFGNWHPDIDLLSVPSDRSFMINKEVSFRLFEISDTSSTSIDSYFKQPLNKRCQERAQAAFCSCWANVREWGAGGVRPSDIPLARGKSLNRWTRQLVSLPILTPVILKSWLKHFLYFWDRRFVQRFLFTFRKRIVMLPTVHSTFPVILCNGKFFKLQQHDLNLPPFPIKTVFMLFCNLITRYFY